MSDWPKADWETDDGSVRLYRGDCLEILPTLPKVDAVVTDPPYGIGASLDVCRHGHERSGWDLKTVSSQTMQVVLSAADEHIIWGGNYYALPPSRGFLIWDKCQPENFTLAMAEMAWCSISQNAKIFRFRTQLIRKEHPTQKPVELMSWCMHYLAAAETILDPFMGSGTTGVACVRLDRRFVGIELEPKYFDIAVRRIEKALEEKRSQLPFMKEPEPVQQSFV